MVPGVVLRWDYARVAVALAVFAPGLVLAQNDPTFGDELKTAFETLITNGYDVLLSIFGVLIGIELVLLSMWAVKWVASHIKRVNAQL